MWQHHYLDKKVAAMEETCGKGASKSSPTTACMGPERWRPSTFTRASYPILKVGDKEEDERGGGEGNGRGNNIKL